MSSSVARSTPTSPMRSDRRPVFSNVCENGPGAPRRRGPISPLERLVRQLHHAYPRYSEHPLTWDDAVAMAERMGAPVEVRPARADAVVRTGLGGRRTLVVSDRVYPPTWGVFCVVHELAHLVGHAGHRDDYLGSPGWLGKVESQANVAALLALWPRPLPYPALLAAAVAPREVRLTVGIRTPSQGVGEYMTSRHLTLQRYR